MSDFITESLAKRRNMTLRERMNELKGECFMSINLKPQSLNKKNYEKLMEIIDRLENDLNNDSNEQIIRDPERLAKTIRDYEKNKISELPVRLNFPHNSVPARKIGGCHDLLIGYIIDKKDFNDRMPLILKQLNNCKSENKYVIFIGYYWDGKEWLHKWKGNFRAVCKENGAEVYRIILDGNGISQLI